MGADHRYFAAGWPKSVWRASCSVRGRLQCQAGGTERNGAARRFNPGSALLRRQTRRVAQTLSLQSRLDLGWKPCVDPMCKYRCSATVTPFHRQLSAATGFNLETMRAILGERAPGQRRSLAPTPRCAAQDMSAPCRMEDVPRHGKDSASLSRLRQVSQHLRKMTAIDSRRARRLAWAAPRWRYGIRLALRVAASRPRSALWEQGAHNS